MTALTDAARPVQVCVRAIAWRSRADSDTPALPGFGVPQLLRGRQLGGGVDVGM